MIPHRLIANIQYFPDTRIAIDSEKHGTSTTEHVDELELLLEKAAIILTNANNSDSSSDESSDEDDDTMETDFEGNSYGRLHCYISCLMELAPAIGKYISYLRHKQEEQDPPREEAFCVTQGAKPFLSRIFDRFVNLSQASILDRSLTVGKDSNMPELTWQNAWLRPTGKDPPG